MNHNTRNCTQCSLREEINQGFSGKHALFVHSLGICSAVALTGYLQTTVVIVIIILLVATLSAMGISLIRRWIMYRARFLIHMTLITTLVTAAHLLLKQFWPEMRDALGPYLGLVITNCLIMDACEQQGLHCKPQHSVKTTFGNTIGYATVLILVALIREPLGHGSLAGYRILPGDADGFFLMASAPGAFFVLGLLWWIIKACTVKQSKNLASNG